MGDNRATPAPGAGRPANKLQTRGAIDDNWEETQRLYEKLKGTGRCAETVLGDWEEYSDVDPPEPQGVWFCLDHRGGKVVIHDGSDGIGEWFSENKFFVLCMENHKRPFFKTPSAAVAYDQSVKLMKLPAKERERFQSRPRW
jgi:hypothetical protein